MVVQCGKTADKLRGPFFPAPLAGDSLSGETQRAWGLPWSLGLDFRRLGAHGVKCFQEPRLHGRGASKFVCRVEGAVFASVNHVATD